jgi:hypothetical protein
MNSDIVKKINTNFKKEEVDEVIVLALYWNELNSFYEIRDVEKNNIPAISPRITRISTNYTN